MTDKPTCCGSQSPAHPQNRAQAPGAQSLDYRAGTHASFLNAMIERLASLELREPNQKGDLKVIRPLEKLRTRAADDPALALLDAWATVADVLTFYQERLANEGYLRTATERRSVLELARLIGYQLQPGVAASVFLAFSMEKDSEETIAAGTGAKSIPGPGELPQTFETGEPLLAKTAWNQMKPRLNKPQHITRLNAPYLEQVYLQGTATRLKRGDGVGFEFYDALVFRTVAQVTAQAAENRTLVTLQPGLNGPPGEAYTNEVLFSAVDALIKKAEEEGHTQNMAQEVYRILDNLAITLGQRFVSTEIGATVTRQQVLEAICRAIEALEVLHAEALDRGFTILEPWIGGLVTQLAALLLQQTTTSLDQMVASLASPPSHPPAHASRLNRSPAMVYDPDADLRQRLLAAANPRIIDTIYTAMRNGTFSGKPKLKNFLAFRAKAAPFGHNAPLQPQFADGIFTGSAEWNLLQTGLPYHIGDNYTLPLDAQFDTLQDLDWAVVKRPFLQPLPVQANSVQSLSLAGYGLSAKLSQLNLSDPWLNAARDAKLSLIRNIEIYVQPEALPLAEEPVTAQVAGSTIELNGLFSALRPGRWAIVSGERADLPQTTGVEASELVMIAAVNVKADANLPGDKNHTQLTLAEPLAYRYHRASAVVYGNVVKATHGETQREVLGSGNTAASGQRFTLKKPPLTHLAAPTAKGHQSTLDIRVNDVSWPEAQNLLWLDGNDRGWISETDHEGKTAVIFGNGQHGSRLPTGSENIKSVYRSGIGKAGNAKAGAISMLATKPLGVKGVLNPLAASGGADSEALASARFNAPMAVMALDRLVSVQDFADFARTFAGIGKASACLLSDGKRQMVHLTIAGTDDIPISRQSDLIQNLGTALRQLGDPCLPFQVQTRALKLLLLSAGIRLKPGYHWQSVKPKLETALWHEFDFQNRQLAQDVTRGEVLAAIQRVEGVAYADLDLFDAIEEAVAKIPSRLHDKLAQLSGTKALATLQAAAVETLQAEGIKSRDGTRTPAIATAISAGDAETAVIAKPIDAAGGPVLRPIGPGQLIRVIGYPRLRIAAHKAHKHRKTGLQPAEMLVLSRDLPDTLILKELQP